MKNPILRLVLALLAVAATGGAGYFVFMLEQRAATARTAERAFAEDVLRLQATLAELRAAQAGYLATGQDAAVWIQKASQLRQQAETQLKRLAAAAPAPEVESDLATVGEALASLGRFDKRIAELLRDEQTLTASALIFTDSAQVVTAATATLSNLRGARASKAGVAFSEARKQQVYAIAGAAAVVFLVLLLLVPGARRSRDDYVEAEEASATGSDAMLFAPAPQPPAPHVGLGRDLDLSLQRRQAPDDESDRALARELDAATADLAKSSRFAEGGGVAPGSSHAGGVAQGSSFADGHAGGVAQGSSLAAAAFRLDLSAAARLCTDLARVRDTSELQGLLARAAALLNASGIVVWMGGSNGDVLWPAFSHGYTPHTLSKMQALPRDGGTPVSVAFRTGLMEVVRASAGDTSGAIVAPILTSSGCVGVMAVEIPHGAETSDAEQAMAGILAAQLATLVAGDAQ